VNGQLHSFTPEEKPPVVFALLITTLILIILPYYYHYHHNYNFHGLVIAFFDGSRFIVASIFHTDILLTFLFLSFFLSFFLFFYCSSEFVLQSRLGPFS
jgi:hypothetical protein